MQLQRGRYRPVDELLLVHSEGDSSEFDEANRVSADVDRPGLS